MHRETGSAAKTRRARGGCGVSRNVKMGQPDRINPLIAECTTPQLTAGWPRVSSLPEILEGIQELTALDTL